MAYEDAMGFCQKAETNVSGIEIRVAGEYVKRDEFRQDIQRILRSWTPSKPK